MSDVNPLDSCDIELKQLRLFLEDLKLLQSRTGDKYINDFEELRDKTNYLRAEYSIIYSKILEENHKLKVLVGGV